MDFGVHHKLILFKCPASASALVAGAMRPAAWPSFNGPVWCLDKVKFMNFIWPCRCLWFVNYLCMHFAVLYIGLIHFMCNMCCGMPVRASFTIWYFRAVSLCSVSMCVWLLYQCWLDLPWLAYPYIIQVDEGCAVLCVYSEYDLGP